MSKKGRLRRETMLNCQFVANMMAMTTTSLMTSPMMINTPCEKISAMVSMSEITRVPSVTDPVQYDVAHGPLTKRAFTSGFEVNGECYTHKLFHGAETTTKRPFIYIGNILEKIKKNKK